MSEITTETHKSLIVPRHTKCLSIELSEENWAVALRKVLSDDVYNDELPIPPEFARKFAESDSPPTDLVNAIVRAQATPEMRSQIDSDIRRALDRVTQDLKCAGDPVLALESHSVIAKIATLLTFDHVEQALVLTEVAEALTRGDTGDLAQNYFLVCGVLVDFQDSQGHMPARPAFDHDDFVRMANYVRSHASAPVTAISGREFFVGDQPVPLHLMNSLIQLVLESCDIWDRQRNDRAPVSNRLISEVRHTMARKCPRWSTVGGDSAATALPHPATRSVENFANDELVLSEGAWIASSILYATYVAWCIQRGTIPEDRAPFFKRLREWGAGSIRRGKQRVAGVQTPAYFGLVLRAG